MESKTTRVKRIARILRESFAHVAPRQTLTVPNAAWGALVSQAYSRDDDDDTIANPALDAVFKGRANG